MSKTIKRLLAASIGGLAAIGGISSEIAAAEYEQDLSVTAGIIAESNAQYVESGGSVTRVSVAPSYRGAWRTETNEVEAQVSLNLQKSSDEQRFSDREDTQLALNWTGLAERGQHWLAANFTERSTKISELDDSSFLFVDGTQRRSGLSGGISRSVTEKSSLSGQLGYQRTDYSGGGFTDFRTTNASVEYAYQQSARQSLYLSVAATDYKPLTTGLIPILDDRILSTTVGLRRSLNERLSLDLNLGVSDTDNADTGNGVNFSALLAYEYERSQLSLQAARAITPSGVGGIRETDFIVGSYSYLLDELSSVGGSINYRSNGALVDSKSSNFEVWYSRSVSENLSGRVSLQRSQQNFNSVSQSYILNASLRYDF